jgi:hypothetical protein
MRRGLAAAGVIAATLLTAGPATAGNGFAMAVDVRTSQVSMLGSSGGSCNWRVSSDVTLVNLTNQSLTITAVADSVSWTGPNGASGVQGDVTITDDGGLVPGITLAPHEQRTFSPQVVEFAIPCSATYGDLSVRVSTPQGTSSGDAPFLENGTPVPIIAAGAAGLAAILGAAFLRVQHRAAFST